MLTYFTGEVGNQKYGNKCKARVQKHGKEESNVRETSVPIRGERRQNQLQKCWLWIDTLLPV